MATAGRTENPGLDRWPIGEVLAREPYRFEFFQAVRLLARMYPKRAMVGRFTPPAGEIVRFAVNPSVAFPASPLQSLTTQEGRAPVLRVNFMGLIGPMGLLPLPYSHLVLERIRAKDNTLRDFFDLFHHRMISLFYQAWEKYRFAMAYERGERDRFSHHILDLMGMGTPGLQDRQAVPDDSLLFYSGLLALHSRSAEALRLILTDYFAVDVAVEQFIVAWYPVDLPSQCCLGEDDSYSGQLGLGAVVGDEVWDQQSRVRIRLGPLDFQRYRDFLPGGGGNRALRAVTRFFAGGEFDVEIQLVLERGEVPACELTGIDEPEPRLGWTSWVKTAPFTRDPGDTVLEM